MRLARLLTTEGPIEGRYDNGTIVADDGRYEVGAGGSLLPPCEPSALYFVGRNYGAKIDEMDYDRANEPDFFIKPPTSLVAHSQVIPCPAWCDDLTYPGELAALIDMHTDLAGERRQEANTAQMLFSIPETVSFPSDRFTFRPGDVISFGRPANPGQVELGDDVTITYESVGTLRNTVSEPRV